MLKKIVKSNCYSLFLLSIFFLLISFSGASYAAGETLGSIAQNVSETLGSVAGLLEGISLIAGIAFAISSIFKFKQHKDNPTQIPVGTPIALMFIGASFIFLPNLISTTGQTLFTNPTQARTNQLNFDILD